jgi:hypothetical protein
MSFAQSASTNLAYMTASAAEFCLKTKQKGSRKTTLTSEAAASL